MKTAEQTKISFRDKWEKNKKLVFSETLREGSDIHNWILERNGFNSASEFKEWLSSKARILDAGCGNGRVTALLNMYTSSAEILGIDLTAADVAKENLSDLERVSVRKMDLLDDLSDLGSFDLIYCQEVLHHTSDPKGAFLNLCSQLGEKGEIAIYVYKKKAPLREYADDYVRDKISGMPYEEALSVMKEITEFGRILSELKVNVRVPEVAALGIEEGEYDIQRLIYHTFSKCFWNPSLSYDENVAINYDWYHPQLCTRHTLEEIESWYIDAKLEIVHRCVDHYGITVRGIKSN